MKLCCDCRVSQGVGSQKIVWYLPEPQPSPIISTRNLLNFRSLNPPIPTPAQSPKSYVTLPKAKLNLSHFRSRSGSTTDHSMLPEKINDESTLSVENVKELKRQNNQYVKIIKTQLLPLKRDYHMLLEQYKRKSEVIQILDGRLREMENQTYGRSGKQNDGVLKGEKKRWRV